MTMLRRVAFKRPVPPWPRRPERQWGGAMPSPRPIVAAMPVSGPAIAMCEPLPKECALRSESYRRYVAEQICFSCGLEGFSQAAHPNFGRGLGQKASDFDCFPLCCARPGRMGCHAAFDMLVDVTLVERRALEVAYTARMRALARAAGRFLQEVA